MHRFRWKSAFTVAAAGAAVVLGAGTALAAGSPSVLNSVSASPGAGIVWAVGESGTSGSFNPLVMQNG
jgi:hypothetical protein